MTALLSLKRLHRVLAGLTMRHSGQFRAKKAGWWSVSVSLSIIMRLRRWKFCMNCTNWRWKARSKKWSGCWRKCRRTSQNPAFSRWRNWECRTCRKRIRFIPRGACMYIFQFLRVMDSLLCWNSSRIKNSIFRLHSSWMKSVRKGMRQVYWLIRSWSPIS